jgi:ribosomal protein S18 acetylase RimI-like enzyme
VKRAAAISVRLRSGTEADVDEIVRISERIWRDSLALVLSVDVESWPNIAGTLHAELIPIARAMLLATLGSRIVGFSYRSGALIEDLWIDPPFQRQGIGPELLRAQVAAIAGDGYRTASLECLEANLRARRFYEREGWRAVYRYSRPSHAFGRNIPRIRFEYDVWRPGRP